MYQYIPEESPRERYAELIQSREADRIVHGARGSGKQARTAPPAGTRRAFAWSAKWVRSLGQFARG